MRVYMLCVGVHREQHLKALFVEKLVSELPRDFVRKFVCKAVVVVRVTALLCKIDVQGIQALFQMTLLLCESDFLIAEKEIVYPSIKSQSTLSV